MVQNLNIFSKLLIRIDTHCLNVLLRLFEQDTFKEKTLNRLLLWMGHYVVDRTKPKLNEHTLVWSEHTVLANSTTDEDYQTTTLDATNNDWDT